MFFDDILEEEKEIFELEKFIFDGYKTNNVVFPNILNLSFLFDDTPADEDSLRKWSINPYYGFYLDDREHKDDDLKIGGVPLFQNNCYAKDNS